jgi:hypothetical protein
MKRRVEPAYKKLLEDSRLLIIFWFPETIKRITSETATIRNRHMIEMADEIVIGHSQLNGQIHQLLEKYGAGLCKTHLT